MGRPLKSQNKIRARQQGQKRFVQKRKKLFQGT